MTTNNKLIGFILIALVAGCCYGIAVQGEQLPMQAKAQLAIGGFFDGCYSDMHDSLQAPCAYHQHFPRDNSNAMCIRVCKDKGFAVVATKGADCYCSNALPVPLLYGATKPKSAGNGGPCNTVCPGVFTFGKCKGDECCGGPNAYSVYVVDSIDILKELINRIATNFQLHRSTMNNRILSPIEKGKLECQCFNGEITIYLKARSLSSDGKYGIRTVKSTIHIDNTYAVHDVVENSVPNNLQQTHLVLKSMEKLLETEESPIDEPFGKWDLLCNNYFGGADLNCAKSFEESASFTETFSTTHGVSLDVTLGFEVENDFLVASSTKSFEISRGQSFSSSRTTEDTKTVTDSFEISITAPKGTKAEVRFFKQDIPVKVKWRAHFIADGAVLIDYGNFKKMVHLSRLLSYDQRKLYAFGTIDYGERPTIIALTKTVDRQGNVVSEKKVDGNQSI